MIETDYSPSVLSGLKIAKKIANQDKHSTYGVAHLVISLFLEPTGLKEIISSMGKDTDYVMEWFDMRKEMYQSSKSDSLENAKPDDEALKVFEEAERSRIKLGTDYIDAICILAAVVREGVVYSKQQIESLDINEKEILDFYNAGTFNTFNNLEQDEDASKFSSFLENLKTEKVLNEGALILGREKETRAILENLERSENKGTLIVGESGIGKSAVIKFFVKELCASTDEYLQNSLIFQLNVPKVLANSNSENEASKKVSEIFDKLGKLENQCILVIDDLQVLLENSNGKSNVITNILNAQLSDGNINMIFTISSDAYRKNLEKHPISGKLEVLILEELGELEMLKCLHKHKERLEKHFVLKISDRAIVETIHLSKRYFKEKKLPYGAIDLLDRTVASVRMSNNTSLKEIKKIEEYLTNISATEFDFSDLQLIYNTIYRKVSVIQTSKIGGNYTLEKEDDLEEQLAKIKKLLAELEKSATDKITEVTEIEVESIIADLTGIPIGKIQAEEKDRLLGIEERLQQRVKGQKNAIVTLSDAIIESRSGLSNPKQPIGSFFFLGPTGTGKTELTKSLAELLFDDENSMIRFDMSEFKEEHSAALLYGAPPGYVGYEEGGMLVNKIRQKPYSVVLFDEIEKAHSSVYDVFLQLMDEGTIHDKLGREGDFSNAIIIFTSNIGSQWIVDQIEEGRVPTSNELIEVMAQYFRPEFLGRLTEVVPFSPINESIAQDILKLHFNRLQAQLKAQKQISLEISEEALKFLSKKGYSKKYGARPIAGVIRTYVKKVISKMIVSEQVKKGDNVLLDYKEGNLVWELI